MTLGIEGEELLGFRSACQAQALPVGLSVRMWISATASMPCVPPCVIITG